MHTFNIDWIILFDYLGFEIELQDIVCKDLSENPESFISLFKLYLFGYGIKNNQTYQWF